MRFFNLAAFAIFALFCIIVAVSNRADVMFSLHPLPFAWEMPLYSILFIGLFIGFAAGALVILRKSVSHARHNRKQIKRIRDLENQLKEAAPASPDQTSGLNDHD